MRQRSLHRVGEPCRSLDAPGCLLPHLCEGSRPLLPCLRFGIGVAHIHDLRGPQAYCLPVCKKGRHAAKLCRSRPRVNTYILHLTVSTCSSPPLGRYCVQLVLQDACKVLPSGAISTGGGLGLDVFHPSGYFHRDTEGGGGARWHVAEPWCPIASAGPPCSANVRLAGVRRRPREPSCCITPCRNSALRTGTLSIVAICAGSTSKVGKQSLCGSGRRTCVRGRAPRWAESC